MSEQIQEEQRYAKTATAELGLVKQRLKELNKQAREALVDLGLIGPREPIETSEAIKRMHEALQEVSLGGRTMLPQRLET